MGMRYQGMTLGRELESESEDFVWTYIDVCVQQCDVTPRWFSQRGSAHSLFIMQYFPPTDTKMHHWFLIFGDTEALNSTMT